MSITSANHQHTFTPIKIFGRDGLSYVNEYGNEIWRIADGSAWVESPAQWDEGVLKSAEEELKEVLARQQSAI